MAPPIGRVGSKTPLQQPETNVAEVPSTAFVGVTANQNGAAVRVGIQPESAALSMEAQIGSTWQKKLTVGLDLRLRPVQFDVFSGHLSPTVRAGLLTGDTRTELSAGVGVEYTNLPTGLRLGFDVGPARTVTTKEEPGHSEVQTNLYLTKTF
jgi:hypothetical protein